METELKEVDPKKLLKEPLIEKRINESQEFLCETGDTECVKRMVQSMSDCI